MVDRHPVRLTVPQRRGKSLPSKPQQPQPKKTCFIVGPIGEADSATRRLADWLLHGVIKPVLEAEEFDYSVKRADEDADPGSITSAVISDLTTADLVIADLTGFNPNAFYELGVRHALRKPVIHIIAEPVKLPFDNADQRTIFVDFGDFHNLTRAKARLELSVRAVNAAGYQITNPVVQAGAIMELRDSADPKDQLIASLEERLLKLERMNDGAREVESFRKANGTSSLRLVKGDGQRNIGAFTPQAYDDAVLAAKLSLFNFETLNPETRSLLQDAVDGLSSSHTGLRSLSEADLTEQIKKFGNKNPSNP